MRLTQITFGLAVVAMMLAQASGALKVRIYAKRLEREEMKGALMAVIWAEVDAVLEKGF